MEVLGLIPCVGKTPLENEMVTHSSIPAWEIPRTKEPGRLPSMGSQRGKHDCVTWHAPTSNVVNISSESPLDSNSSCNCFHFLGIYFHQFSNFNSINKLFNHPCIFWNLNHKQFPLNRCLLLLRNRYDHPGGYMVAQMVENLPAMQETQVGPLCQEDPVRGFAKSWTQLSDHTFILYLQTICRWLDHWYFRTPIICIVDVSLWVSFFFF